MAKNKRQHLIPNSYLKAWCDPNPPPGHHPYIWRIRRDNRSKIRKSPEKSFTATDRYTVKLPDGTRDLTLENTLADIESHFVNLLPKIIRQQPLQSIDRAYLCLFAAAMFSRTKKMGEHWRSILQQVYDKQVALEQKHNAKPITSLQTAKMVENAPQGITAAGIEAGAPLLSKMQMAVLVTASNVGFITSDNPCILYNPKLHTFPPAYRSPGLGQHDIEVTLPISPQHLLFISHNPRFSSYIKIGERFVDEFNRRTLFHCENEFVSATGEIKSCWFEIGPEPQDTWENSEEGRHMLQEVNRFRRAKSGKSPK